MAVKIVDVYSVSPSEGAAAEQTLPLLYFDVIWLQSRPAESLNFYDFKCSEPYFMDSIVVKLKQSLSIALKHFLPLAGKVIFPIRSAAMPVSRYSAGDGDSVSLTIAVSDSDFADVTGNHSKLADELRRFVPQLPPAVYSANEIRFSALAIQVTLFPNQGFCIGITDHHAISDAASLYCFLHAWASIHKLNGDEHLGENLRPFYGRSCVQDANRLTAIGWNQLKTSAPTFPLPISLPPHIARATFILNNPQIEILRSFAMRRKPAMARPSTFVVVSAHLWSCLAKSAAAAGEDVPDIEPEYFTSAVDCRTRLNPPLPGTYYGNCLVFLRAESTHGILRGHDGFVSAVEAIAAAIRATVGKRGGILDGFENQSEADSELIGKRWVPIAGSSRIDPYAVDYGWGRASKCECIHTDFDGTVNLYRARDGGAEIGFSMPKVKMDIFADIFKKNLCINSNL